MSEYTGMYRASVHDIADPERRGRLRLLVPQVLGESASAWAEPSVPPPSYAPFDVGDMVWVQFEGGNLNYPIYSARPLVERAQIAPGAIGQDEVDPESLITGPILSTEPPPATTEGYAQGTSWWYVDDEGNVLGMWRVEDGSWGPVAVVNIDALVANDALIGALQAVDLTAVTMTGATIQTRSTQERGVKLGYINGVEGLFVYREDGTPFLKAVPAEGMAVIAGEVKASSLTVAPGIGSADKTSLGGLTEITRHSDGSPGAVRLTAYTTAPASAPTLTTGYFTLPFQENIGEPWSERYGLVHDSGYYYTTRKLNSGALSVEKWDAVSGLRVATGTFTETPPEGRIYHASGVTVLSGELYALWFYQTATFTKWYVSRINMSTLTEVNRNHWPITQTDETRRCAIGAYGTELIIAKSASPGNQVRFYWNTFNPLGSVMDINTTLFTDMTVSAGVGSVYYGMHDGATNQYVVDFRSTTHNRVTNISGSEQVNDRWPKGSGATIGMVFVGGEWKGMDQEGTLRTYTTTAKISDPSNVAGTKWWVANSLARPDRTLSVQLNSNNTINFGSGLLTSLDIGAPISGPGIPAGTTISAVGTAPATSATISNPATSSASITATVTREIQTDLSPKGSVSVLKRSTLTVTASDINSGGANAPDRIRAYVGTSITPPTVGNMFRVTPDPAAGVVALKLGTIPTSGTTAPTSNGFLNVGGAVQRFELADGTVVVDGLGDGSAWKTWTPVWTANTTNPTLGNGSLTGSYWKVGKTVHVTISLQIGSTTTLGSGAMFFTLPFAPRAPYEVVLVGISQSPNRSYVTRCEGGAVFQPFFADSHTNVNSTNSSWTTGTLARFNGTYEVA